MKTIICIPTYEKPHPACLESLAKSVPLLDAEGIKHETVFEVGCPYISGARATMLTKALKANAEIVVFIDDDVSWDAQDLVRLIKAPGDVVAGTYRFKTDESEAYMGVLDTDEDFRPKVRGDGAISATRVPAGFLKVRRSGIEKFMHAYPELCLNDGIGVDLFNHGAINGTWFGEDYAFSKRWIECGGQIWLIPDVNLTHNHRGGNVYPGNFHNFMRRQPGGDLYREAA